MLDLTGHDRFLDTFVFKEAQKLAELTNADPGHPIGQPLNLRVSLFANSGHGNGSARPARTFDHEKREFAVACY